MKNVFKSLLSSWVFLNFELKDNKKQGFFNGQIFGVILCSSPRDRHQDKEFCIIILES